MKKILNTDFFGYAGYKYRRLIRTLILLVCIILITMGSFFTLKEDSDMALGCFGFIITLLLITALISFLMEPFIIEKTNN